jgi:hypothetical protein
MSRVSDIPDFNKSAYVALSCLIAFVIVITICVIKQFIWDPLLSKGFETLRPVLSESVRKFSSTFHRPQSTTASNLSLVKSFSDTCVKTTDPPLLSSENLITITQSLPSNDNQYNPINKKTQPRSYGSSSFNSYAYTNFGSDDLGDEQTNTPILHFSCEYNPSTFNIRLNIQNLRHMNIFNTAIKSNDYVLIRFSFLTRKLEHLYETTPQHYQDFIRFGETFIILKNIHPGDILNYHIKFFIVLIINESRYEIAETIYSMQDDSLTYVVFVERTLPMSLKSVENQMK